MSTITLPAIGHARRTLRFLRHLLEMTVSMMLGMFALGLVAGVSGFDLLEFRLSSPELALLGMAFAMSVPMVAWMRHRGHGWRMGLEMSGAMFVPPFALVVCYWLGGVSAEPMCPLACGAMIPAMAVAMLFRLDDYAGTRAVATAA
jgi:flagellar biosynthetic protein FliP